jgi:MinD-like ATPase involved in chromosome partitioning or flagellar assembly
MTVVALGAIRSCGVSTLTLALAATWPSQRRVLLAECDPAGGTLAAASGWAPEPGLVSLAAAARRDTDPELVWGHCYELAGGAAVLAGPSSADQARSALGMLAGLLARLGELSADVLVDCGRLAGSTPARVYSDADRVVLVARPQLSDLHALTTWLEVQPSGQRRPELVLVGDGPYSNDEVAEALGIEVLARLPWDPDAATSLVSRPASARELGRTPLVRSARSLAEGLWGKVPAADQSEAGPVTQSLRLRVIRRARSVPSTLSANGSTPQEVHP